MGISYICVCFGITNNSTNGSIHIILFITNINTITALMLMVIYQKTCASF